MTMLRLAGSLLETSKIVVAFVRSYPVPNIGVGGFINYVKRTIPCRNANGPSLCAVPPPSSIVERVVFQGRVNWICQKSNERRFRQTLDSIGDFR